MLAEAFWKVPPKRVIVPYAAAIGPPVRHLSRTRHVKAGLNPRGPSRKAKYSLATDSEKVARAKDGKNPDKGRTLDLKPHAYKRSKPCDASRRPGDGVPFA